MLWVARLSSIAAVVPLWMILIGESGTGPSGLRGWVYLALFPIGFSFGYLIGWRWPIAGGLVSLTCMAASLVVIGKVLPWSPYMFWGILSVPGILFLIAGWRLRAYWA